MRKRVKPMHQPLVYCHRLRLRNRLALLLLLTATARQQNTHRKSQAKNLGKTWKTVKVQRAMLAKELMQAKRAMLAKKLLLSEYPVLSEKQSALSNCDKKGTYFCHCMIPIHFK